MINKRLVIGHTTTSKFTPQVREMITDFYGAIPVDLNQNIKDIEPIVSICDGIIFSGGPDIWVGTLGRELTHENYKSFDPERDELEIEIIRLCEAANRPYLCLCRGLQLVLSQRGMYLIPDISTYSTVMHSPGTIEIADRPIHFVYGVGKGKTEFFEKAYFSSYHHEAILYQGEKNAFAAGVEVLAIANTVYEDSKNKAQFIVELARGKNFICSQSHIETQWQTNPAERKVAEYFKKMLPH